MKILMFRKFSTRRYLSLVLGSLAFLIVLSMPCIPLVADESEEQTLEQQKCLEVMKSKGTEASLTIVPVVIAGTPMGRVAQVVGLFLERAGMTNLEIGTSEFRPEERADFQQVVTSFSEFVRKNPMKTDYVLYGEFIGGAKTGVEEVRGIVVDKTGKVIWLDRQTPEDDAFKKAQPQDPMSCAYFLVERLCTQLGLEDPMRKDAPEGKIAKMLREQSGVPPESELKAMAERQKELKKVTATATLTVFPVHLLVLDIVSEEGAAHLVKMINDAGLLKAVVAKEKPMVEIKKDPNEAKVLWSMADSFRNYIRDHKPNTEYVLYAGYHLEPQAEPKVRYVHFVVCDKNGEWVIIDLQNNHHTDFNSINPQSREDCDRLVIKRLEKNLR